MERILLVIMTFMLSGRAMTLAFIHRAGGTAPGDPPAAWLMPLIGDAVIGLTGLAMIAVILRARGLWAWTALVVWNTLAIWDALSAFIIHLTNPWPQFFMIHTFGALMFFIASAMHATNVYLLTRPTILRDLLRNTGCNANAV